MKSHNEQSEFSYSLNNAKLYSGGSIDFPRNGVTVITGPNNCGKSTLLRQLVSHLRNGSENARQLDAALLIESVDDTRTGNVDGLWRWLSEHAIVLGQPGSPTAAKRPGGGEIRYQQLGHALGMPGLTNLTDFLIFYGDAWNRISHVQPVEMRNHFTDAPNSPFHVLQDKPDLLDELSALCKRVFGVTLTMDRVSKNINLRVGETGVPAPAIDRIDREYIDRLSSLPHLTLQGDGMKSLIGLLIPVVTSEYRVVIIDEPEAFLHPPQAGVLGRILGEQASSKNLQVVVATHDKNFLAGILESGCPVNIIRLSRPDIGPTQSHQLRADDLLAIWQDPVLKYTNVLDGLFHRLVVLAEAEADCRFYAAALAEYEKLSGELPFPASDIHFVPAGGKGNLHKLAAVLKSVRVPVVVSPDLDVINNKETLRRLVAALGAEWEPLESFYEATVNPFRQSPDKVTIGAVLAALKGSFDGRESENFTAEVRRAFTAQMRLKENPWEAVKKYGTRAFRGQSAAAAESLVSALDEIGIAVVKVGELEQFAPTLGVAKGPAWLPAALTAGAHRDREAVEHVKRIIQCVN